MTRTWTSACLSALWLVAACRGAPPAPVAEPTLIAGDEVTVTRVIKGDEIEVERAGQPGRARVRLLGIDTLDGHIAEPAMQQYIDGARRFTAERLLGKQVRLDFGPTLRDVRGRWLALIDGPDGQHNLLLVEAGLVLVYNEFGFKRELPYLVAEQRARAERRGLWADPALGELAVSLRRDWALARRDRDGSVPEYYLAR